jgi:hypothetical protein
MERGGLKLAMIFATGFLAGFARLKPLRDHRQKTARFPDGPVSTNMRRDPRSRASLNERALSLKQRASDGPASLN